MVTGLSCGENEIGKEGELIKKLEEEENEAKKFLGRK